MNTYDISTGKALYKRGVKGEVREWRMELGVTEDGIGAHRVVSGIKGGKMTESGWTVCEPKNVGKKNATTSVEQARSEIENLYKIKSERGYFYDIAEIDNVPFTKPMLAVDIDKRRGKFNTGDGLYAQPKLDGIRCIARADGLFTRTGKPIIALPHIVEALGPYFDNNPDLILDGELYNHSLKDDFNTITSIVRKSKPTEDDINKARDAIEYHIYDMPSHAGVFSERRDALLELFEFGLHSHGDLFRRVETVFVDTDDKLDDLYAAWLEDGFEGQMIRLNDPYQFKRSNSLMKRKDFLSDEFEVSAVHEGLGNWMGYVKRFTFLLPDGRECGAGVRGTQAALKELLDLAREGTVPDWATVRYFTPTPDGMPRFPVVTDWGWGSRED